MYNRKKELFFVGHGRYNLSAAMLMTLDEEIDLLQETLENELRTSGNGDAVRELYSELLERYCQSPAAVDRLRVIGSQIERLVATEGFPRAIVRRGTWRHDS